MAKSKRKKTEKRKKAEKCSNPHKWNSRKIIGLFIFELLATILLLVDKLDGMQWINFSTMVFATYVAGNVMTKATGFLGTLGKVNRIFNKSK